MAVVRGRATDIRVDQIPLGKDYGIDFEAEKTTEPVMHSPRLILEGSPRRRRWLTWWNGWDYERVRELPPDASVSFEYDGTRYIYYGEGRAA